MICCTRLRQCHNRKKKKKHTTEPLRSQEGFLEKVIPELSLKEREKHSYE